MQAAIHTADNNNLTIVNNFEIPKPKPDQVLIQVQASGVCHSDVSLLDISISSNVYMLNLDQVFFLSLYPDDKRQYIMGHEATGVAIEYATTYTPILSPY